MQVLRLGVVHGRWERGWLLLEYLEHWGSWLGALWVYPEELASCDLRGTLLLRQPQSQESETVGTQDFR